MGCSKSKAKHTSTPNSLDSTPLSHPYRDIRFKYDFLKTIGCGNYGTVRLACLKNSPEDLVAVKTMTKERVSSSQEMLETEIQILFSLDHPNIIQLIEVFEDAKYVHLVTEHCSGGELFDRIVAMGRYSEHEAARLLHKILLAVNNLHHNNVCHRDLKPENFMFKDKTATAELKLIDFGLSKFFDKFGYAEMRSLVGTPNYVAPEVLRKEYGPKCDIWSVGVIMYVILSGQLPFAADTLPETYERIAVGEYCVTAEIWRNVSPHAIDLLRKLLVVDPELRFSAEQALAHPWFTQSFPNVTLTITHEVLNSFKNYRVRSKFQSEAYHIIVKHLDANQIKDLKEAFMSLDREENGFLSVQEVQQGLVSTGFPVAANEIEEIMRNVNIKKDGRINYSEFLAATLESRVLLDDDAVWAAFNTFDVDSSGFITEANVKEALRRAGRRMSHGEVGEMMREVGADRDGLDYDQFKQLVRQDTTYLSTSV